MSIEVQPDIEGHIQYMRDTARDYGLAKGQRIYLEQFRKSKKALLMAQAEVEDPVKYKTSAAREQYAYAHNDYREMLRGIKEVVAIEEDYRWRLEAAKAEIEVWRTRQANNRRERTAYGADNGH